MSTYAIMRAMREWYIDREDARWLVGATSADIVAAADGISVDEAELLVQRRIDRLYEAGVHPMTLVQMSRLFGFDIGIRWHELRPQT